MLENFLANPGVFKFVTAATESAGKLNNITFDLSKVVESTDGRSNSVIMSLIGYAIVFASLLLLATLITLFTKYMLNKQKKKLANEGKNVPKRDSKLQMSGEINAAIAMALHMHFDEVHDFEHTILTIDKVKRNYSPWSSKLYSMRKFPEKK